MNKKTLLIIIVLVLALSGGVFVSVNAGAEPGFRQPANVASAPSADNPAPPASPVKLIFIHHSTGQNWLDDGDGGLGIALRDNNYFVSDTNYGWGPDSIGDHTDIPNWDDWFVGPEAAAYTAALYAEFEQHSAYSRLETDPGGPNEIVMFKSCYPNSNLEGNPADLPLPTPDDSLSVANAKAIYNAILTYFQAHQEKLFIVITAPPLAEDETDAGRAANARAFNNWLVNNWLDGYAYHNVAVFDFYHVLTSNGGDVNTNDYSLRPAGNHHYWNGSAIVHPQTVTSNYSAYPGGNGGSSHPTAAGNTKATAEFVDLLNIFYNRWRAGQTPTPALTLTSPNGAERWPAGSSHPVGWNTTGTVATVNLYYTTDNFATRHNIVLSQANTGSYNWLTPVISSTTIKVRVESVISPATVFDVSNANFTLYTSGPMDKFVYLPLVLKNSSATPPGNLIQPADLSYLGAFRLPGDDTPPQTFAYGGNAVTFNPDGDTTNADDYPGSLFITGHDRTDDHPDGNQIAEVTIPVPVNSRNVDNLPYADFIQGFQDVTAGHFQELSTVPKVGLQYLNHPDTGPLLHITWGRHLQQLEDYLPSQGWVSANLAQPDFQGEWFIGDQNPNGVNGYLFEIPATWADTYAQGRYLATGRFSPGGMGGMGPTIFAYRPWETGGTAPASGAHLTETPLLHYESSMVTDVITHCMNGYQHADSWEGGAWLTTSSGKGAVLFAGTKATGVKYWYGYIHPTNPMSACVDLDETSLVTCRLANGNECPQTDYAYCCDEDAGECLSARGWWSTRHDAQLVLYNPADLAQVAAGTMDSWEPQPYAVIDVDDYLYLNPPEWDVFELGWGDQRRNRLGDVTYDPETGRLYVLELSGDSAKPMVHVWQVNE